MWSTIASPYFAFCIFSAIAMPTAVDIPWPSGPVVVSTPSVWPYSGWPGVFEPSCLKFLISSMVISEKPTKWLTAYKSIEPCPADNITLSLSGQSGFWGSIFKNLEYKTVVKSAAPIGIPGWPQLAFSTASAARNLIALAMSFRLTSLLGFFLSFLFNFKT